MKRYTELVAWVIVANLTYFSIRYSVLVSELLLEYSGQQEPPPMALDPDCSQWGRHRPSFAQPCSLPPRSEQHLALKNGVSSFPVTDQRYQEWGDTRLLSGARFTARL